MMTGKFYCNNLVYICVVIIVKFSKIIFNVVFPTSISFSLGIKLYLVQFKIIAFLSKCTLPSTLL